jgi:formate hydrogenlyase subunit 3/multisubunit Na+/H+ antiporter MnhD subunit
MGIGPTTISWGIILILLPLAAGVLCFLFPRQAKLLGGMTAFAIGLAVIGLARQLVTAGAYPHQVGGWGAPLGINLYADGLSLVMLAMTALVALGVSVYSLSYFQASSSVYFWPLWLFLLAALNALFLSADIFNLYVTLEMIGLAAVALTALTGGKDALGGAMRYLLSTLLGSLFYLFGVALLYHGYSSVDIFLLAARVEPSALCWAAFGLICAGLVLKTALFPLHFWLPPAHASAPAPVSAILSALVVKGSFYILLRLWLELFSPFGSGVAEFLGILGATAVLWGSLQAFRQARLKLLIAYSTVAQIGYLFLAFPLSMTAVGAAWRAAICMALAHGLAKAAMFLAAGNIMKFGGHDRIIELDRIVQRLPVTAIAFGLAGVSIIGLPPSGGFVGKWLLLEMALQQQRWDLVAVIVLGGFIAAAYVFRVLGFSFTQNEDSPRPKTVPATMEWGALALAVGAILLGFFAPQVLSLLGLGGPLAAAEIGS